MNINLTIMISFIIISFGIFASSVIHFEQYEPFQYIKIKNTDGDDQLIRINKIKSSVDVFLPNNSGFTNFNWIKLN